MLVIWVLLGFVVLYLMLFVIERNYYWNDVSFFVGGFTAFLFFIVIVTWPVSYLSIKTELQGYYALKDTIEIAREDDRYIERAALTQQIAEVNMSLRKYQYWYQNGLSMFIPKEIMDLEPIK